MKRFGDIVVMFILLPLMILMGILVGLYFVVRFPLWWIERALKTRKRWLKWRDIDII
jgi:thiosulfate reductase cytochrome b subunit